MGNLIIAVTGAVLALLLGFIFTFFTYKDKVATEKIENNASISKISITPQSPLLNKETIQSPFNGKVIPLKDIKDAAFASGALGQGVGIIPKDDIVVSPVNGVLSTIFPTYHAICITSDNGTEILIHIGMNTVELNGKYFDPKVKEGDKLTIGQPLIHFNREEIEKAGYSLETPVLITNETDEPLEIIISNTSEIQQGDNLFTVLHN